MTDETHGFADRSRLRTLVCTEDGVFFWPGIPLLHRYRGGFQRQSAAEIYTIVSVLHGPAIAATPLITKIDGAARLLEQGDLSKASASLNTLWLPPVSQAGAHFIHAVADFLDLRSPPPFDEISDGAGLCCEHIDSLADALDSFREIAHRLEKVFVPDEHPRWPTGEHDGGEFRPKDGPGDGNVILVQGLPSLIRGLLQARPKLPNEAPPPVNEEPALPDTVPESRPDAGDKPPPESEEPTPVEPPGSPEADPDGSYPVPPNSGSAYRFAREAVEILRDLVDRGNPIAAQFAETLEKAEWLAHQIPNIISDFDPPKKLEDLINAALERGPHPGYENHHIVEKGPQNSDLPPISQDRINSPENIVRIPYYKHVDISAYYATRDPELGDLTPRQYLRGKSWQERYEFGLYILRKFKVLE